MFRLKPFKNNKLSYLLLSQVSEWCSYWNMLASVSPSQMCPPGGIVLPPSVGPELDSHCAVRSSSPQTPWIRSKESNVSFSLFSTFSDTESRLSWKNKAKFLNASLYFKPVSRGVVNLEAELLSTGVHRGGLSHSRRPSDEHGVAEWSPSRALSLSLAPEISTVPHICMPVTAKQFIFSDFFWNQSINEYSCKTCKKKMVAPLLSSWSFPSGALVPSEKALCFHFFNQLHNKMKFFFPQSSIEDYNIKINWDIHLCSFLTVAGLPMTSLEFWGLYLSVQRGASGVTS